MTGDTADLTRSLLPIFAQEAAERLASLATGLRELAEAADPEARDALLGGLVRQAHTIKGSARTLHLDDVAAAAEGLEHVFRRLRTREEPVAGKAASALARLESIVRAAVADVPAASHREPPPAAAEAPDALATVLYVEDSASNLQLVERVLAHRPRLRLLTASDGASGLELARRERPDLVLLDLHLPRMPGEQVLQALRKNPATCEIPVVVVSADAMPAVVEQLLAAGARAFLTKPIDVAGFLALIDEILGLAGDSTVR